MVVLLTIPQGYVLIHPCTHAVARTTQSCTRVHCMHEHPHTCAYLCENSHTCSHRPTCLHMYLPIHTSLHSHMLPCTSMAPTQVPTHTCICIPIHSPSIPLHIDIPAYTHNKRSHATPFKTNTQTKPTKEQQQTNKNLF